MNRSEHSFLKITLAVIFFTLIGIGFIAQRYYNSGLKEDNPEVTYTLTNGVPVSEDVNVDVYDATFFPAIAEVEKLGLADDYDVRGGIVPHHDLVNDIIADFFYRLSKQQNPDTIIIVAPIHTDIGLSPAFSGRVTWRTPVGIVEQDYEILDALYDDGIITYDNENYIPEHAVKVLTPFIEYFLPDAKIVPILLRSDFTLEETEDLANRLSSYIDGDTSIIGSVDFSHYLTSDIADINDEITYTAIRERDYEKLFTMNSDYLDSFHALVAVLSAMDSIGYSEHVVLGHTNSAKYMKLPDLKETTSYFSMLFTDDPKVTETTMIFGGDVMLSRSVNAQMEKYNDYTWPFLNIASTLSGADLTVANLESPFAYRDSYEVVKDQLVFKANPKAVEGLVSTGIDIVSLANNHFGNQGQEGMHTTLEVLDQSGIGYVGGGIDELSARQPIIREINSIRFGFLSYGYPETLYVASEAKAGIANMDIVKATADIEKLKNNSDVIIVLMHAGTEYVSTPNSQQREFARAVIDAGADLVIGHHPHWPQIIEEYNDKPIIYSLGNLVFDQVHSAEVKQGVLAKTTFRHDDLYKVELLPINIKNLGQPEIMTDSSEKASLAQRMNITSLEFPLGVVLD